MVLVIHPSITIQWSPVPKLEFSKKKLLLMVHKIIEPNTFTQASKYQHWVLTMENEYTTLFKNNTWQLVPSSTHANIIGCKWVHKLKCKPNGPIDRYKACLVAQGFTHTPRLDYFVTFSLDVKVSTIRITLAISLLYQWPLW